MAMPVRTNSSYRRLHAIHAVNRYLWEKIKEHGLMDPIPSGSISLVPIVPVEETPELITAIDAVQGMGRMPFIVYNWSKVDNGQMWYIEAHEAAYSIRASDQLVMRQLINLFDDLFKRYDDSAQEVNEWIRTSPSVAAESPLRAFHFYSISISSLGGQMPTGADDGSNEALISLRILFSGP